MEATMRKSVERRHGWRRLSESLSAAREAGMTTAEYAVGTMAACWSAYSRSDLRV
ncbi:DUF4244 domain-containing protein [Ornithinimicrobium ciconiae]|uniref:DUF4244 domain-containing protein n=1 Tax=Ornithinimicrobium ciconiae TaxID=2594265 RepID=A0A516GEK2_9MICO|nr:DUF4244 domain-containing protein [Ornithinimicrobium ciconiae]